MEGEEQGDEGGLFAFVRLVLSFWANLKLQTNIFSVKWQKRSTRSVGQNNTRYGMEGWGGGGGSALNINNVSKNNNSKMFFYNFQGNTCFYFVNNAPV